jgi:hypothetical protein
MYTYFNLMVFEYSKIIRADETCSHPQIEVEGIP